jgi:chromosome segregation ATPase
VRRERERLKEDAEQLEEMAEELRQKSSWVAQQHTEASSMLTEAQQGRRAIEDLGVAVASERDELLHLEAALTVSSSFKRRMSPILLS